MGTETREGEENLPLLTPRTQMILTSLLSGEDLLPPPGESAKVPAPFPAPEPNGFGAPRPERSGGGLTERIAARAGFSAPKLNTSQIRSAPETQSSSSTTTTTTTTHMPFSPGISPSVFLDSPVFLYNSLGHPSPTTGTFPSGYNTSSSYMSSTLYKTDPTLAQPPPLPNTNTSVQMEIHNQAGCTDILHENQQESHPISGFSEPDDKKDSPVFDGNSPPPVDQLDVEQREVFSLDSAEQAADDRYNWRKYGQKQVKGSEYPRSYYKCTHPDCPVRKKVERSPEGHVTEITYKGGAHSHPLPPLNRRTTLLTNTCGDLQKDPSERQHGAQPSIDGRSTWASTSSGTENSEGRNESADPVSNEEEEVEEDGMTNGNGSLGVDGDGDSEWKKRKLENSIVEMSAASRAIREPRVVVQTTSEVDILDDGYRWRKYGQKVVKGNPNPRSYYKCTSAGCTVRKHVERASHDLKSVITTYEGKHNHEVPAARNSSHSNSNTSAPMASQNHSINRRGEHNRIPESFPTFDTAAALRSFNVPLGRENLTAPPAGFSFDLGQTNFAGYPMSGLGGQMHQMLPQVHSYLGQRPMGETRYMNMIPKNEPIEQRTESGHPIPNEGSVAYQQMIGRLPLGP